MSKKLSINERKAVSSIIGAIMLFAMLITVGSTYFYVIAQDQKTLQSSIAQNQNNFQNVQSQEHLAVYGVVQSGELAFYVNNTGISASITAYWILNQTGGVVLEYCPSPPAYCSGSLVPSSTQNTNLPFNVQQGQSKTFNDSQFAPSIIVPPTGKYVIKLITREGVTSIGTYPSQQLTSASVNSLVAGGFGSLEMQFSSFSWYSYISGPPSTTTLNNQNYYNLCSNSMEQLVTCNGGNWKLDINHPHSGSLVPGGYGTNSSSFTTSSTTYKTTSTSKNCCTTSKTTFTTTSYSTSTSTISNSFQTPIAFSVNITNDDPALGTIVINSASNLWVIETCDSGVTEGNCPSGNPFFVFYVMNVNPSSGAIYSNSTGSFAEIQIPYGVTRTLYYGAAYDTSLQPFSVVGLTSSLSSNPYYYGQFAVFLLFAGTKIVSSNSQVYGQNIPFESTTAADNFGWYYESPISCNPGTATTFSLNVNDSIFASTMFAISKIVLNASAFSAVSVGTLPAGWKGSAASGTITWTNSTDAGAISPGVTNTFKWTATAPSPTITTQYIFPLTITWDGGEVTTLQAATVCTVT